MMMVAISFMACTDDDAATSNEEGSYDGKVRVVLATRANTGEYVPDFLSKELISTYSVVFADDRGNVVEVVDGTCSPTVELDPFDVQLSAGNYKIYAFANISKSYINSLGLVKGGKVPADLSTKRFVVPDVFNNSSLPYAADYAGFVPMTGICPQEIEVTGRITQTFAVEVRRIFAKVEFVFQNNTPKNLQLNALSISDMTVNSGLGSVLLMNYEEDRDHLSLPAGDTSYRTLSYNYGSPLVINSGATSASQTFYVLESRANNITNSFQLDFNITDKGVAPSGDEDDYMRYGLTNPATLTLIHRNDWITIPITLIDWQMRLEARSYPPIGGYPEAEIEETASNEFVVTFHGGGDFSIRPFIRKYSDGSEWFGIDDKAQISGTPTVTVDDPMSLFTKTPELKATGEIIGRMRVYAGYTACITVTADVVISNSPLVTKTLKRKIYVTQK